MARYEVFKIKDGAYEIMDNAIGLPLTAHGVCDLLNACELPAVEVDENSFVHDGVRYVSVEGSKCSQCYFVKFNKACASFKCAPSHMVWKRATQPRAMSSVEIAKKYGKGGYAFQYVPKMFTLSYFPTAEEYGICLIDDLCNDVSKSPWFMPMVDESGVVTEVRCG